MGGPGELIFIIYQGEGLGKEKRVKDKNLEALHFIVWVVQIVGLMEIKYLSGQGIEKLKQKKRKWKEELKEEGKSGVNRLPNRGQVRKRIKRFIVFIKQKVSDD